MVASQAASAIGTAFTVYGLYKDFINDYKHLRAHFEAINTQTDLLFPLLHSIEMHSSPEDDDMLENAAEELSRILEKLTFDVLPEVTRKVENYNPWHVPRESWRFIKGTWKTLRLRTDALREQLEGIVITLNAWIAWKARLDQKEGNEKLMQAVEKAQDQGMLREEAMMEKLTGIAETLNKQKGMVVEKEELILFHEALGKYQGFSFIEYRPDPESGICEEKDLTEEYFRRYVMALVTRDMHALEELIDLFKKGKTYSV